MRKLLNLVPGLSRAPLSTANSAWSPGRHAPIPFMKLAYLTTNQAILEAMKGEVHHQAILEAMKGDVRASRRPLQPGLQPSLVDRALPRLPRSLHLRITAVHNRKEFLANMAGVLAKDADAFDIQFQSGEALAISVVAQLHLLLEADDAGRRHAHVPGSSCLTPVQIIALSSPDSLGELLDKS
ncbi:scarecrow-like protein 3 [Panicum virgatum]|uniref:scarecrow-like protein 3 n=1 Tax=Panicum virgatum TaxID=38727 RepID=UPI0019D5958E|nr:scarecrow-like protein 3 [Panicum virgatum]